MREQISPSLQLCRAAEEGDIGGIRAALADGVDPNKPAPALRPITLACRWGQWLAGRYLAAHGAEFEDVDWALALCADSGAAVRFAESVGRRYECLKVAGAISGSKRDFPTAYGRSNRWRQRIHLPDMLRDWSILSIGRHDEMGVTWMANFILEREETLAATKPNSPSMTSRPLRPQKLEALPCPR